MVEKKPSLRSDKIKFTDKRWIVQEGIHSWYIKTVKARIKWMGNDEKSVSETLGNVNLIKNAPRLYHCVEKLLESFKESDMTVSLDENNNNIEYWKKKAISLQKIRGDMEYWAENAEKLLELIDYIYDGSVPDNIERKRNSKNGGFYSGTKRGGGF